ncbi:MAG: hypothetical protein Q9199_003635 [Rusavskia elegans]
MAPPYTTFGGYAKLPTFQYATLNPQSFQYSNVPTYAPPPDPPPFEPPADHPVEKDDEAVANDEAENPRAEGSGPPAGEEVPSEEKVETSEAPEAVPENEAPADGVLTAEPISDSDHPGNPGEAQTQESTEGSENPEPTADTAPIDLAVDDGGNEGGENRHKEAEFPPIEPGEVDEDTKAGEPVVNVPADEVVEAAPITSPEAAPAVEPTPDAATTGQLPPATAGPADDKAGKKSKKSSKTKEKESKSKIKAKEKEKAKEAEKEKEKEKDKSKEKEKEKAKSSGKKKKGKAKVDPVALPNDEPGPSPDGSCPPDASAVETQAEAVADAPTETPIDPPTETPNDPPKKTSIDPPTESSIDPPTETPFDPPTETPPEPVVKSESPQSEGVTAEIEQGSLDEKPSVPDQVSEPGNEAGKGADPQTKDLTPDEAITDLENEGNLNDDPSAPITQEAKPSKTADVEVATPNDSSEAAQPSMGIDENPTAPPTTNDDVVANDAPSNVSDTNPPSGPANVEIVEVIEHIAKDTSLEPSPSEIPNDLTPTPEATQPEEEKIEVIEPLPKAENRKVEEQPDLVPEAETAAIVPTNEPSATETIQEAPQSEVLNESPPENTQAGDQKSEDQPIHAPQAETAETALPDSPLESPSESAPEAVKPDDKKVEVVEPPLEPGDVKAEEQSVDVTQTEAAIVDTEALDRAIEYQIEEKPAADEPPIEIVAAAVDEKKDDAIQDQIQNQPAADEPPIEIVAAVVDEKDDKATEDWIEEKPAADEPPIEIVAAAVDEKAIDAAPAEILPPVEQSAPVEEPSDLPCVEETHNREPIERAPTEMVPSKPTLVEEPAVEQASTDMAPCEPALVKEPTAEPVAELAPIADAPPSPNSEKHRKKKAAGWERPQRYSKTSTAGSDLSGSKTKTGPLSDKSPSESTATKQKRHSSRRTFELDFAGKGTDHGKSERPKISRSSTSRRSHRTDREPEPAARPRILERVKTEADGRAQYRVNDSAPERPSRRREEESFRREHRSDKHRDGDRHRERDREREKEREKQREREREEAKEREREKEKNRQEEDEQRRERRRRRREEEDRKSRDGEGKERHHRHREHDRERRRRDSSPPPAKKIGKWGSGLRKLLAI